MIIKIHRGQNQIGGNIIEIASNKTKILLDIGCELDGDNSELPEIDGLFDYKGYDAVFISHYHFDHLGLAYSINDDIPLYIGEDGYKIIQAVDQYKNVPTITPSGFMRHSMPIQVGDLTVTPYLCDHSAFDSYMVLVEANGESVLYTGDFRSNGRKSFDWLLRQLPEKVDTLICEGTTLSRDDCKSETERDLEARAIEMFSETEAPIFVLQSAMNIDRVVTVYKAARRCNRLLLQDLYMAEITTSIGGHIPNPIDFPGVRAFISTGYDPEHFRYKLFNKYGAKKISRDKAAESRYVMCIRASMYKYIESISKITSLQGGLLVYSMWDGYKKQDLMKDFLKRCEDLGLKVVSLHTSGHADADTIRALIKHTKPTKIIPVHTVNAGWFEAEYSGRTNL